MTRNSVLMAAMLAMLLTGVALDPPMMSAAEIITDEAPALLGGFPATFEGELPCADCPGIFYHLDLFEDGVFFLRTTYLGRGTGAIFDTIGSWELGNDGRLALFGDAETPMLFRVVDPETLRKLDVEGRDIESSLNYDLRRKDGIGTIEPRLTMRGMYRYMADAALFAECLSGRRFAVAQEGDNAALERAYLDAQRQPGEALLVSLQGRIAERPAMEGDALVLTVVPEHFIGVWPGETCGARETTSELFDTRWELTRLGDEPIVLAGNQRAPYLVLSSENHRVSGFGACNRFNGSFKMEGRSITFSPIASTKMACIPGGDTDAIGFYERFGAKAMDEWTVSRISCDALDGLARSASKNVQR